MKHAHPHIALFGLKGFPARGGTASVGENIVKILNKKYRFTVYATSSHASDTNPYKNVSVFIFKKFLPHKLNIFYYNLMSAIHAVLFCNYDLVHTNQIDTGFIVPILRLKYKVISTHHGKTYKMSKWGVLMKVFFRLTERLMMSFANRVTFVADSERIDAERKFKGDYLTINNGFSSEQAIMDLCFPFEYIMFAAGRIVPHKGCHVFLEALKRINYKGKVLVVGDHRQLEGYGRQLIRYKEFLDVEFVGMLTNKAELFGYVKNAKLFVFPSFYEAMSMMLLEVVAVKTPIICSNIIENTSVFNSSEVDFFEVGDVDDLAEKISYFLRHKFDSKGKVEAAYRKLAHKYQWKDIALEYDEAYSSLLE